MTANTTELKVALRQLRIMEEALQALRDQLHAKNPDLLDSSSPAYERRIGSLQADISEYLFDHPTDVSLIVRDTDFMEASALEEEILR